MPQTINFHDLPRFLACPGSALMQDKADLLMGPEPIDTTGEELTLEPFLPVSGYAEIDKQDGKLTVTIAGANDAQALTAAALAAHGKYDFVYEFKEYELKSGNGTIALFDLDTIKQAGSALQQQFREAQQTGDLRPGEQCASCPAVAVCPAIENFVGNTIRQEKFRKDTAAALAVNIERVTAWVDAAKAALVGMMAQGTKIDGYSLGEGQRVWRDEDEAWKYLSRNVKKPKDTLMECRLKSPDDVEAALEDAEFNRPIPDGKLNELTKTLPGELVKNGS